MYHGPGGDAGVVVWDPSAHWRVTTRLLEAHPKRVTHMAFVGERYLCTSGDDDTVRVWDTKRHWMLSNAIVGRPDSFRCLLSLSDFFGQPVLATAGVHGKLQVWDVAAEWPMITSLAQSDEERDDGGTG